MMNKPHWRRVQVTALQTLTTFAILIGLPDFITDARAQPDFRSCGSFRFNLMHEGPWTARAKRLSPGETCGEGRRWSLGGNAVFKRLYLAKPPQHGTVRLQEGGRFFYTAPTNFRGNDTFTLRVCGVTGSSEGCANVVFPMRIRPARS
jgi:hypothetical protein